MTVEERLSALEARVAELEARQGAPPPSGVPAPPDFWALAELQRRAPPGGAVVYAGQVTLPDGTEYGWQMGHAATPLLRAPWDGAADALAALGHPLRLALLQRVLRGERTVAQWQATEELSGSGKLYHHLRDLQAAGWLVAEGRGRYRVPGARVVPLLVVLAASGGLTAEP